MGHRILVETTQVSLYQFRRKRGGLVVQVSLQVSLSLYYRLPNGTATAMQNVALAAI